MRSEEEYLRVLYFSYFMTKLHLQLILHLYPGEEGALNILLGVAVPEEKPEWSRQGTSRALQTTRGATQKPFSFL
jgi:hypothetical protein